MVPQSVMKYYVVEYSCLQQCFHLETIERMIKGNIEATMRNVVPGYIPLFITDKMEEADQLIAKLRPLVENRPLPVNPLSSDFAGSANVTAGLSDLTIGQLINSLDGK